MRTWAALDLQSPDAETSDLIQAFLLDFGVAAIDDNLPDASRIFFHDAAARDGAADALTRQFPEVAVRAVEVPDEDWVTRSQANLRAVQVGRIIVAPPWDVLSTGDHADPIVIVIQPSMGFGTGHHATTRLCLAALQQHDLHGLRAIDVGTGSGVLAIAASRLGAAEVVAIDDDPDAIAAARENLTLNPTARVESRVSDVRRPDPESRPLDPFDIATANLTGGLLIAAAGALRALVTASGRLVLSGLMDVEESAVLAAFSGCAVEARAQEDEWICLTLRTRARS